MLLSRGIPALGKYRNSICCTLLICHWVSLTVLFVCMRIILFFKLIQLVPVIEVIFVWWPSGSIELRLKSYQMVLRTVKM